MKTLVKTWGELEGVGRWDIDFHLPPELIQAFNPDLLQRVDSTADISKDKRDPTKRSEEVFSYIDISSVDVTTGLIANPQELTGAEAPSRARKVVAAYDIVISTCRPTRGAIAVVPPSLHNQIASTGFSVVRPKSGVNPYYLHFALRQPSTLEQFRKWSTGSSYPAILDDDVSKTIIPVPDEKTQDDIAAEVVGSILKREKSLRIANFEWEATFERLRKGMYRDDIEYADDATSEEEDKYMPSATSVISEILNELPPIDVDETRRGNGKVEADLFSTASVHVET